MTKKILTDGADWARLQAKAKLFEQTLSHAVGRFLLVRREKKKLKILSCVCGSFALYWQLILFKLASQVVQLLCDGFMPFFVLF